jgi:hypothetical protein
MNRLSRMWQRVLPKIIVLTLIGSTLVNCKSSSDEQSPDPVVEDFAIIYLKRPMPLELVDDNEEETFIVDDLRLPNGFRPGAELFVRNRATADAIETSITNTLFVNEESGESLPIDIKDVSVSFDGTKVLFALRAPEIENADEDEQPKWDIWEYDHATQVVRRIIQSDIQAEAGDDLSPAYLADGRIIFSSTRNQITKAILLDEGKPQYNPLDESRNSEGFSLHVMDDDGQNIKQLTFNPSHDLFPVVRQDGYVAFTRWDNYNRNRMSLYQMRPDGTELSLLYGYHSHTELSNGEPQQFSRPQVLPDGNILVEIRPYELARLAKGFDKIDVNDYIDNQQGTSSNISAAGPAQTSLFDIALQADDSFNPQGYYASVSPLWDGTSRYLVSYSSCRLNEVQADQTISIVPCSSTEQPSENQTLADPLFGLWIYNESTATQLPIFPPEEGMIISHAFPLAERPSPIYLADKTAGIDLDEDLVNDKVGVLNIKSVYDRDGVDTSPNGISTLKNPSITPAANRPIRFVRLMKQVPIADEDIIRSNGNNKRLMRDILGYAEVHPDGSVQVQVPANIPFEMQLLNANGERISARHNNWLQVRPGGMVTCNGCHTRDSTLPHGRTDAEIESVNRGAELDNSPHTGANPSFEAIFGETMAETYARTIGIPQLDLNLSFTDNWADPATTVPAESFSYRYQDLATTVPTNTNCLTRWESNCRIVINYPEHLHALWAADRQILDENDLLIEDHTCTSCHTTVDSDGLAQVPASQLDLTDGVSDINNRFYKSYIELLANDNEQELIEGNLTDRLVQSVDEDGNPIFEVDEDGELILDDDGNPIPVLEFVNVSPAMSGGGARSSSRFFNVFANGNSHNGYLTEAELKLLREWLDTGARYYNDPFKVPQN